MLNNDCTALKEDLRNYNSYDIFYSYGVFNGGTSQEATLSWDSNHVGTITRENTAESDTVFGNILGSNSAIPAPLVIGESYVAEVQTTDNDVSLQIVEWRNGSYSIIYVYDENTYTVPDDINGLSFRIYCQSTFSGNATIKVRLLNTLTNKELTNKNVLAPDGAKILSYGNSILTGSVWVNGSFNHLAKYSNSPYGNIANALNVSKLNVDHVLLSSTGFMYDDGNGSFLDNILDTDITGYDYILTHLWYQDMTSSVSTGIGSLDSTAGDGTIAGSILSLLEYIRENNKDCTLILVGVPPTGLNGNDLGKEVFSRGYSNGANIMECDYLVHQLAQREHFVFVDWEGWDISYKWKEYTDSVNIHLNNEDTYRQAGEYLAKQITAQAYKGESNIVVTDVCIFDWISESYIGSAGEQASNANFKCSDFIPVSEGEIVKVYDVVATTSGLIYITCYNVLKGKIADVRLGSGSPGQYVSGVKEYTIPTGGAYIRVTTGVSNAYCHVWHRNSTYIPHKVVRSVADALIESNEYAQVIKIEHNYIEGAYVNENGVGASAENWANTGYVYIGNGYDYIKLVSASAAHSCFALFFDSNHKLISTVLSDTNGEYLAEQYIAPPRGAVYIRCNMVKANKDAFAIYGLKTRLVDRNFDGEKASREFRALTGNKLNAIFKKIKAIGPLFTISDDDTTSLANVQKFHTVCSQSNIRGCYAVMTKNTEADPDIVAQLLDYEKEGFQCVVHCHHQRAIFKTAPDRDIDACRDDMATALQYMQRYGFGDYRHWISPYGVRDQEMKDLARDFGFDSLITVPTDTYCHFIPHTMYDQYAIPRMELYPTDSEALNGNTLAEIKAQMLDCANNGGWFHVCTHMYQWGDDLSRVTEMLDYANTLGMKNVTISGGLSYWRDIYKLYGLF